VPYVRAWWEGAGSARKSDHPPERYRVIRRAAPDRSYARLPSTRRLLAGSLWILGVAKVRRSLRAHPDSNLQCTPVVFQNSIAAHSRGISFVSVEQPSAGLPRRKRGPYKFKATHYSLPSGQAIAERPDALRCSQRWVRLWRRPEGMRVERGR